MLTKLGSPRGTPREKTVTESDLSHPKIAVIAAYNEDRFIGSVVLKTRHFVDRVIVVDDGSTDHTAQIAEEAGAVVLRHETNRGKAQAVNTGLIHAREANAALVVLIDADGQHDPAAIPVLIAPVEAQQADVVVGSRFLTVRSTIPRWRVMGQHALTVATNLASGVTLTDSQSGFRALSRRALDTVAFRPKGGFSIESEMQFLVQQHRLTVKEVPVRMTYEEASKRNPFGHGFQVLNGIIALVSQHRPLFFFGVPGLIILIMGIVLGLIVVDRYNTYQNLAVGYALISILLDIIGIQMLFTGIVLHSIRAFLSDNGRS
ncbi:MAG: glycosyltransferase family 2 protein [Chloroflexi bacterium]|nr:MAG: glycosyltransferase family 2 protein [Chloroflexota bacterium]